MRIAFCHHLSLTYFSGGEKWIIEVSKELQRLGHEVAIHALPFLLEGKRRISFETLRNLLGDIPYHEGLVHRDIRSDVSYITYSPQYFMNFQTKHPRIGGIHSYTYWMPPNPHYGFLPVAANLVNRSCSYFVIRGFDAFHTINDVYIPNHERVYIIPNFVDADIFHPCKEKEDKFTVAFAGRPVWQKGIDIYHEIERKMDPEIHLKTSGLALGETEYAEFLSSSHVLMNPARVNTFGIVNVEANLCGTPVVASPLLPHKCLRLPMRFAESPKEYVKEIKAIKDLHDSGEYETLSEECRQAGLHYDKRYIMERIEQMFREVAKT